MIMKLKHLLSGIGFLFVFGCASFSTHLFRTEQTIANVAHAAYVGYTNGLANGTVHVNAGQSNAIKDARLKLAASLRTLELWRAAYETNSAVKPQAQAALDAAIADSSNVINLIHLFTQ